MPGSGKFCHVMSVIKHFPKQGKTKSKSIFSICRTREFMTYIFMFLIQYLYYPKSKHFEKHILSKNDFFEVLISNENLSVFPILKSVISFKSLIMVFNWIESIKRQFNKKTKKWKFDFVLRNEATCVIFN